MSHNQWYVRIADEVLGPMSEAELKDLAQKGAVRADTLVSHDQSTWTRASKALGSSVPLPPPQPPAVRTPVKVSQPVIHPAWIVGGVVFAGFGFLVCGGLLLGFIGSISEDGSASLSEPSYQDIVGQNTYDYWTMLGSFLADSQSSQNTHPQAVAAAMRSASAQIRSLPTANVDPDAVQCGNDAATVLANMAQFVEESNNPAAFVEAFIRGAAGDPFGKAVEMADVQSSLQQQIQYVQTELDNTRAVLSSRYGVEFPGL